MIGCINAFGVSHLHRLSNDIVGQCVEFRRGPASLIPRRISAVIAYIVVMLNARWRTKRSTLPRPNRSSVAAQWAAAIVPLWLLTEVAQAQSQAEVIKRAEQSTQRPPLDYTVHIQVEGSDRAVLRAIRSEFIAASTRKTRCTGSRVADGARAPRQKASASCTV